MRCDQPVYAVTYVEVTPASAAAGRTLLEDYRVRTRRQDGSLRCEVAQRVGQPHQFVILEVWKDQTALDAHGRDAATMDTRVKLAAIRNAPTDERIHHRLALGPIATASAPGAIYVVTHVDVIPPRKDDGAVALERLAEASRKEEGNLRFDVVQQASRPNHFTVVEIWKDATAVEAHSMTAATRAFRDALAPMTGALYDERMYAGLD
ncbi:MAG TPA: antibiotic biosynthesis monooxygenase [Candidatus Acidoferrum sp.]|jgi:quinol monooxygenase YgiN|nr:antibiotic biosynthesis monooxygenase [Candidatus Acidoferrum sp.]